MVCFCHVCNDRVLAGTRHPGCKLCEGTVATLTVHPYQEKLEEQEIAKYKAKLSAATRRKNEIAASIYRSILRGLGVTEL